MPCYLKIAVNVPLGLLTYAHIAPLPRGTRVLVPFINKTVAGIVWGEETQPEIAAHKIRAVQQVFADEPPLPESWLALIEFTARYYHYPIGQTAFTALPQALRENRRLIIDYTDQHGNPSRRQIQPIALGYFPEVRLLAAWCEQRQDFRHFRCDRIQSIALGSPSRTTCCCANGSNAKTSAPKTADTN